MIHPYNKENTTWDAKNNKIIKTKKTKKNQNSLIIKIEA